MSIPFYILYEITIQILGKTVGQEEPRDEVLEIGLRASKELLERSGTQTVQEESEIAQ